MTSKTTVHRVFNFSAGPAAMPVSVLEEAQRDLLALPGAGMSILEISHRSKMFEAILAQAEAGRACFGAVRATRAPLPMCEVEVLGTYPHREDVLGCRNPEFHELPRERATFRVFATIAD